MRTKLLLAVSSLFLVLALGSGCVLVVEERAACFDDLDCLGDAFCDIDGFCTDFCNFDSDCPGLDLCDTSSGFCFTPLPGCSSDIDCDMGDFCAGDGLCYPYADWAYECVMDGDCPGEGVCDGGVCSLKYACTSDLDCFDIADYCNPYGWCAID